MNTNKSNIYSEEDIKNAISFTLGMTYGSHNIIVPLEGISKEVDDTLKLFLQLKNIVG